MRLSDSASQTVAPTAAPIPGLSAATWFSDVPGSACPIFGVNSIAGYLVHQV